MDLFTQVSGLSVPVAQWAEPLLIGHAVCWPGALRILAGLGSNLCLGAGFSARLDKQACYGIKFLDMHTGYACVVTVTLKLKGA